MTATTLHEVVLTYGMAPTRPSCPAARSEGCRELRAGHARLTRGDGQHCHSASAGEQWPGQVPTTGRFRYPVRARPAARATHRSLRAVFLPLPSVRPVGDLRETSAAGARNAPHLRLPGRSARALRHLPWSANAGTTATRNVCGLAHDAGSAPDNLGHANWLSR